MLQRLDNVLQMDSGILDKLNASKSTKLAADDLRILCELLIFLLPFENGTDLLQGEYATAGLVLPQ